MDGTSSPIDKIKKMVGRFFQGWVESNNQKGMTLHPDPIDCDRIKQSILKMQRLLADHAVLHPELFPAIFFDESSNNKEMEKLRSALDQLTLTLMEGVEKNKNYSPDVLIKATETSITLSHTLYFPNQQYTWREYYKEKDEVEALDRQLLNLKTHCSREWVTSIRPIVRKYADAEMDYLKNRRDNLNEEKMSPLRKQGSIHIGLLLKYMK